MSIRQKLCASDRFRQGRALLALNRKLGLRPLVISAGMPRSGSTLLFNMLRLILKRKWQRLSSGWCDDIASLPAGDAFLIKTHALGRFYRWRARNSFYTYRDVRVVALSAQRKFGMQLTLPDIAGMVKQYEVAKKACDLLVPYELLISDKLGIIKNLARILDVRINPHEILAELDHLDSDPAHGKGPASATLLHPGHRTGTKDAEWRTALPNRLIIDINNEFAWWFDECGYPLT